jgi:hypothetical protein
MRKHLPSVIAMRHRNPKRQLDLDLDVVLDPFYVALKKRATYWSCDRGKSG